MTGSTGETALTEDGALDRYLHAAREVTQLNFETGSGPNSTLADPEDANARRTAQAAWYQEFLLAQADLAESESLESRRQSAAERLEQTRALQAAFATMEIPELGGTPLGIIISGLVGREISGNDIASEALKRYRDLERRASQLSRIINRLGSAATLMANGVTTNLLDSARRQAIDLEVAEQRRAADVATSSRAGAESDSGRVPFVERLADELIGTGIFPMTGEELAEAISGTFDKSTAANISKHVTAALRREGRLYEILRARRLVLVRDEMDQAGDKAGRKTIYAYRVERIHPEA